MKIRYFVTNSSDDEIAALKSVFSDFGLHVLTFNSGCDSWHDVIVSDAKIPAELVKELREDPPGECDWSDSEHDVKAATGDGGDE